MSIDRKNARRSDKDPSSGRMNWIRMAQETTAMNEASNSAAAATTDSDAIVKCSMCGHPFKKAESKVMPFCSVRCQQLDLGMWLDEKLGLPVEGHEEQEYSLEQDDIEQ